MKTTPDNHLILAPKLSHFIAYVAAALFMVFCIFSERLLPDYFSWDTQAMTSFASGILTMDRTSAVIANLIRIFSLDGVTWAIRIIGVGVIFFLLYKRRHVLSIAAAACSLIAMAPLSLVRPQKEILVIFLTILVTITLRLAKKPSFALAIIVAAYVGYTVLSGRPYYWLITGLIVCLTIIDRLKVYQKVIVVVLALIVGAFLPASIYKSLADTRDIVNATRIINIGGEGNRTVFINLSDNYNEVSFLINYAYAFLRLNVPLIFSHSPSDIFSMVFVVCGQYFEILVQC